MKTFTATLCLTLTILIGSVGVSASAAISKKGYAEYKSDDYATALHVSWLQDRAR